MTSTKAPRPRALTRANKTVTGTWALVRFILRRDRIRISGWLVGLTVLTVYVAIGLATLYPAAADRQTIAATMDSPAGIAMSGVNHGADDYHFGAMMGHQQLWFTVLLAGRDRAYA